MSLSQTTNQNTPNLNKQVSARPTNKMSNSLPATKTCRRVRITSMSTQYEGISTPLRSHREEGVSHLPESTQGAYQLGETTSWHGQAEERRLTAELKAEKDVVQHMIQTMNHRKHEFATLRSDYMLQTEAVSLLYAQVKGLETAVDQRDTEILRLQVTQGGGEGVPAPWLA
jgi:hypothetical protein